MTTDDRLRLQDPGGQYPGPPFPWQPQPAPGLAAWMQPRPDQGETSYHGHGRLQGRRALVTGGDSAARHGYEVHVPVDACGGTSPRTEAAAFRRIESFDADIAVVTTLGAVLAQDLTSQKGVALMRILQSIMG